MASITFRGKKYKVEEPVPKISYGQLYKYVIACNPGSQTALTKDIIEAASFHLLQIVPDLPYELIADRGIFKNLDIQEVAELFNQITAIVSDNSEGIVTIELESDKDEKIKQLQAQLEDLKKG